LKRKYKNAMNKLHEVILDLSDKELDILRAKIAEIEKK